MNEPLISLPSWSIILVGAFIGCLSSAVAWLTRQLLKSKNDQITALELAHKADEVTLQRELDARPVREAALRADLVARLEVELMLVIRQHARGTPADKIFEDRVTSILDRFRPEGVRVSYPPVLDVTNQRLR